MKYLILIIALISWLFSAQAQKTDSTGYTIKGVIEGIGNSKVLLGNKGRGYNAAFKLKFSDSVMSKNDTFYFKGYVKEPGYYSIEVPDKAERWIGFILDNSNFMITGSKDSIYRSKVRGGKEWELYRHYVTNIYSKVNRIKTSFQDRIEILNPERDSVIIAKLRDSVVHYQRIMNSNLLTFIDNNRNAHLSLMELHESLPMLKIDSAQRYFNLLSEKVKTTNLGQEVYYRLFEYDRAIRVGQPVPNLTLPDVYGNITPINKFAGKYTIIDFWASWCAPCLEELPALKSLYANYKTKGVEILAISLDVSKASWLRSSEKHKIEWINLSDLSGSSGSVAKAFNVEQIPQKYLIGPDGKLIIKNGTLEEVRNKLDELLANKNL